MVPRVRIPHSLPIYDGRVVGHKFGYALAIEDREPISGEDRQLYFNCTER